MSTHYDHQSDAALMRAAQRSSAPYGVIYRRHADAIFRWAVGQVGDSTIAADLTAETFAIGWEQRRTFTRHAVHDGDARPWLFGIAHNVLRMWARSRSTEARAIRRLGMHSRSETWDSTVLGTMQATDARLWLDSLGDTERDAVALRVVDGMSYQEISRKLNCSSGAARMRVLRGLKALRELSVIKGDKK